MYKSYKEVWKDIFNKNCDFIREYKNIDMSFCVKVNALNSNNTLAD